MGTGTFDGLSGMASASRVIAAQNASKSSGRRTVDTQVSAAGRSNAGTSIPSTPANVPPAPRWAGPERRVLYRTFPEFGRGTFGGTPKKTTGHVDRHGPRSMLLFDFRCLGITYLAPNLSAESRRVETIDHCGSGDGLRP